MTDNQFIDRRARRSVACYWRVEGKSPNAFGVMKPRRLNVIAKDCDEALAEALKLFPDLTDVLYIWPSGKQTIYEDGVG